MTGSRDDIRALNAELVEAYYKGESVASIASRSGRDNSTISKLIRTDTLLNGPRPRTAKPADPRLMVDKKTLSKRHTWIGIQIARYRAEHDHTPTQFGMLINASRVVVRNMEVGAHDFTLCQIDRLSEVLKMDFQTLTTPALVSVTRA